MTPFVRRYEVPLYCQTVYVVFADSLDEAFKACPSSCDGIFDNDELRDARAAAVTKGDEARGAVLMLFVRRYVAPHIVAHEALHASRLLLFSVGVGPMDENNEEAYSYLLSWLVTKVVDAQRKDAAELKQAGVVTV